MATMFQIIQFLDGNGDPYDSGAVYWYEAGTSTPKDTWVDEAESTPASHPVDLDSDGRPDHGSGPSAMWLRGSYKMVLKDAPDPLGNTIITIDDINLYDQLDWTGLTATIADLNSTSTVALLKTSTYTVSVSDRGKTILADASGGAFTINPPAAATAGNKFKVIIKKIDSSINAVTIDPNGTEKIDERTTYGLNDYFDFIEMHSDGSNWHVVSSQIRGTIRAITAVTTLTLDDNNKVINANANAGAFAVNLPSASVAGKGWSITVKKTDSSTNSVTLTPTGGQTIDGLSLIPLNVQYSAFTVKSDASNWFIVSEYGDTSTGGAYPPQYYPPEAFLIGREPGDVQHDILFSEGACRGVNNLLNMRIGSAGLIKQIDAGWAAGTNQGGFGDASSLIPNTYYHCFIIGHPDGTTDAGFDRSLSAVNLLGIATGYTDYRRVGSVKTDGSSNIHVFNQKLIGGVRRTLWDTSASTTIGVVKSGAGPSTDTVTVEVPPDVYTKVFGEATYEGNAAGDRASIFNVDQAELGALADMLLVSDSPGILLQSTYFEVYTNTTRQMKVYQTGAAVSVVRYTVRGWEE